mgnify:CR=1 FL=1
MKFLTESRTLAFSRNPESPENILCKQKFNALQNCSLLTRNLYNRNFTYLKLFRFEQRSGLWRSRGTDSFQQLFFVNKDLHRGNTNTNMYIIQQRNLFKLFVLRRRGSVCFIHCCTENKFLLQDSCSTYSCSRNL